MRPEPAPPESAEDCRRGAAVLVDVCAGLRPGERAYLLADERTRAVADHVAAACRQRTAAVRYEVIEGPAIHGGRPPAHVGDGMAWADVVFCLTSMSLAHTDERRRACDGGTRFLSLPDYSLPLLAGPSLRFDFPGVVPFARRLTRRLDGAAEIRVRTALGTDLRCSAAGRRANCCPGVCHETGSLGSPPDAEVNVAPLEGTAEGVVHVDGSIPCREIG
jgi:leucyl aminopeptidase (aminopeptidase T)